MHDAMNALALTEMVDRVFADRYRVEALVGAGTISAVYRAVDPVEGRHVALKVFDEGLAENEAFISQLFEAVERTSALNHQNIVDIYDWGVDGAPFIVSQLCEGGSLASLLAQGNRLDPSQALVIALEATRALNHGHEQGVIHRGLNPRNVLFSANQRVRLSDHGLAVVLSQVSVSQASRALENVRYSSPEQARGRPITEATDLYSLALCINEAVTGAPPSVRETVVGTLMNRAESAVDLDPGLRGLLPSIERCGRIEAADRPEADELTIALLASAETMPRPDVLPLPGLEPPLIADAALEVAGGRSPEGDVEPALDDDDTFDLSDLGDLGDIDDLGDLGQGTALGQAADRAGADADAVDFDNDFDVSVLGELDDLDDFLSDEPGARPALGAGRDAPANALDSLEDVAPAFAAATIGRESDTFDVPSRVPASASRTAYEEIEDDADDRLPWWPLALLVVLIAAASAALVLALGVGQSDVSGTAPSVTGLTLDQLDDVVDDDIQVEVLERREEGSVAGAILAQSPAAGEDIGEEQTLTVTVSLGNPMVELPSDIAGLTLDQAASRLQLVGLTVGELTEENSEALAAGLVVGINEPTSQKPAGQSVALRISLGPLDRTVPNDVVGLAIADATSLLAGLRLQAVEEPAYSPDAPAGTVLAAIPVPGAVVPADSSVTLIVSAGPEPVEMPDIIGLTLGEARDVIEELGLIFLDSEGTPGEPVIGSLPPIGATVDVLTEVTIILDDPEEDDDTDDE